MSKYIATSTNDAIEKGALALVYGIGDTAEEAVAKARAAGGDEGEYATYPCTDRLAAVVEKCGGGPELDWDVTDGVADVDTEGDVDRSALIAMIEASADGRVKIAGGEGDDEDAGWAWLDEDKIVVGWQSETRTDVSGQPWFRVV